MFVHGTEKPPNAEPAHPDARPRTDAGSIRPIHPPGRVAPAAVLALQRGAGNAAVTRLVATGVPARRPVVQRHPENALFTKATQGTQGIRLTEDAYLAHVKNSIDESRPMAFIVNAILPYQAVDRIPAVVDAIVRGFSDGSRVAVVLGVNARAGDAANLDAALAGARAVIEQVPVPVALVRSVFPDEGEFPYGTMRNAVLHSEECRRMTEAFAATGRHPYISVQDFDTGSRQVPGGRHVFEHFERRLGDSDDMASEESRPVRPLLAAGGYRLDSSDDELIGGVRDRYRKENRAWPDELAEKPTEAQLAKRTTFLDRFKTALAADMQQRDALAKIHPLLPYAPEPNLLFDALPNLLGPKEESAEEGAYPFAFGPGGAEFSALGRGVNAYNAWELSKRSSQHHEGAPEASPVDATTPTRDR
jgi:hypothetical protein